MSIIEPEEVSEALAVPPAWKLVAYLCIGYPAHDSETAELERVGWQSRTSAGERFFVR